MKKILISLILAYSSCFHQDLEIFAANGPIVTSALSSYLSSESTLIADPAYSFQYGFSNLDLDLQPLVGQYISTVPVYEWPLTVRYAVFPEVYGNIQNSILQQNLRKLAQLEDSQKFQSNLTPNQQSKGWFLLFLELFDKLIDQQMLKKKIDAQILNSTQLYIEAEDLLKKVNNILV